MLLDSGTAPASPNPPASSSGVNPCTSSNSANGLPRVSATSWSRTRASRGPVSAESRSARASASGRPSTTSSGSPAKSPLGLRAASTKPIDSACNRRATNASTCAEARSSHCSSSTTQISGCSSAASESRRQDGEGDEESIRRRSGTDAKRGLQRIALRDRETLEAIQHRRHQLVQSRERELHLRLDTCGTRHAAARRLLDEVLQQRRLAHAGLAADDERPALARADRFDQLVQNVAFAAPAP